jgi:hypothetical protein
LRQETIVQRRKVRINLLLSPRTDQRLPSPSFGVLPYCNKERARDDFSRPEKEKAAGFAHGLICSIFYGVIQNAQAAGSL